MATSVGVHEAKPHLSRLLGRVAAGQEVEITDRGRVVARLVGPARRTPTFDFDRGNVCRGRAARGVRRRRPSGRLTVQGPGTDDLAAWPLAALMVVSGITHFTNPGYYRDPVPSWLPARSALVVLSGLADVAVGVLVAVPATRRTGARATAALITSHLPAHLEPLRHRNTAQRASDRPAGVAARVAVNLGYVAWAAAVARRVTGRPRSG